MFCLRGVSKYRVLRSYVREKRRLYSAPIQGIEDAIVQALCWTDPYAMLTITNYPSLSVYRLVCELFFDQQAHSYVHSSDVVSLVALVVLIRMKSNLTGS
jgi:hypothetical protein